MASTHTLTSIQSSSSNAAGATKTSTVIDNRTSYGATVVCQVTNGATGPTIACSAFLDYSGDNTTFYAAQSQTAGLTASVAYPLVFQVPASVMYFRIRFTGNTGQAVTVIAHAEILTSI